MSGNWRKFLAAVREMAAVQGAVTLHREVVEQFKLKKGDEVDVSVHPQTGAVIVRCAVPRRRQGHEAVHRGVTTDPREVRRGVSRTREVHEGGPADLVTGTLVVRVDFEERQCVDVNAARWTVCQPDGQLSAPPWRRGA
jgi:antitoxin component of MazEF toxin-antitoxin module